MANIKGIILDVDGVIVGEKIEFNSPYPHPDVIQTLKSLREKGIIISLCTAKPHYSIQKIITDAGLNNLHITNGGGVIIDPIHKVVLKKHVINKEDSIKIIEVYLKNNVYTEFYTVDDYFIQSNQASTITKIHMHILQRDPKIVASLIDEARKQEIVKIMPIAKDESDKQRLIQIFKLLENMATLSWGIHPIALPYLFAIITEKDISKKQAAMEIASEYSITPQELLGIGDSASDWQFIQSCGYAGAMGNSSNELKEKVLSKGDHGYIGKSVDKNGVIDIFKHFSV